MKLLFVSEFFWDSTNANALCLRNLLEALNEQKIECDVVCPEMWKNYEDFCAEHIYIHSVATVVPWFHQKRICLKPLRYGVKLIGRFAEQLFICPSTEKAMVDRCCQLINKTRYDAIIAVYQSEMAVRCVLKLGRKTNGIMRILYLLDPMANSLQRRRALVKGAGKMFDYLSVLWLKSKAYRKFDLICSMEGTQKNGKQQKSKFAHKMHFVYLPLLRKAAPLQRAAPSPETPYRLICYGSLDTVFRSPIFLLDVLKRMNSHQKVEVDFYTSGDCESILREAQRKYPEMIRCHGYISREMLMKRIAENDAVICINNAESSMIPSKVFDILTMGVPAISFSSMAEDPVEVLFSVAPNILMIKTTEGAELAADRIESFLKICRTGIQTEYNVREILWKYTPEYNAEELVKLVGEKHVNGFR